MEPTEIPRPCPVETGQGLSLSWRGRNLLSPRDPVGYCQQKLSLVPLASDTLFFIPSPLWGYGLEAWSQTWPEGCHGLILEVEAELLPFTFRPENNPRFTFLSQASEENLEGFFQGHLRSRFRRVVPVFLSGASSFQGEVYEQFRQRLESQIQLNWQNRSTLLFLGQVYLRNFFTNLTRLAPAHPRAFKKPVVVAGAGESLEHLLPDLRSHRNDYHLVAADTALPVLIEAGLTPDVVVALEGQIHNLQDFMGAPWENMDLWADLTVHPATLQLPFRSKSFFLSRFTPLRLFDRLENYGIPSCFPRGSVGVTALERVLELTCGPVGLIGLDFSFFPGKTHSRGAPSLKTQLARHNRLRALERPPTPGTLALSTHSREVSLPNLRQYGQLTAALVQGSPGIYDLRPAGWPLGLKKVSFEVFLTASGEHRPCRRTSFLNPETAQGTLFLQTERKKMDQLWSFFDALNQGSPVDAVQDLIEEMDWLVLGYENRSLHTSEALSRMKLGLAYWWDRLKEL